MKEVPPLQITSTGATCNITRTDRYGNVTLNISRKEFDALTNGGPFSIETMKSDPITEVSHHYTDVPRSRFLCRFNRQSMLEICVNHGSAAELMELDITKPADLFYTRVRISV